MNIRINLLPHRQIRRAELQRQFGLMAAAVAAFSVLIIFMGYTVISADVSTQNSRNERLKTEIAKLDADIKEIEGLKEKIGELKDRIQTVESLQTNRSMAVMMLDEIARQLPEAVSIKSLKQKGAVITLEGIADTNARVATLVGNLGRSNVLISPQLLEIKTAMQGSIKTSEFILTVNLKMQTPAEDEKAQDEKAKPKGKKP